MRDLLLLPLLFFVFGLYCAKAIHDFKDFLVFLILAVFVFGPFYVGRIGKGEK